MRPDFHPQLRMVFFCSAALVAMIAADCLRVVGLRGLPVSGFCLASSAILGLMLIREPIVETWRRLKLARQPAETVRKKGPRDDRETRGDPEQK